LASAEDALAELEADVDAELVRAELVARRRSLHSQAIALLGRDPGEDVEWALRHHRVRVHDGSDRTGRLKEALESAGVMIGDEEMPPALLIDLAKIWLDEQGETTSRRELLGHELSELEARLALVDEAVRIRKEAPSAEDVEEEANERAARKKAHLDDARSVVRTAEQRLERQTQIEEDIAERKAELESATRAEEAVASALTAAEAEADASAEAEHTAAAERSRREAELAAAVDAEQQAKDTLDALSSRLTHAANAADSSEFEQAVADAQAAVDHATAALEGARRELALIDAQLADLDRDGHAAVVPATGSAKMEELEWYLLSRVAAQRSVSYAGSVPLVLDDALADIRGAELVHLLSRLERMSSAVQVIVVSEDDEVAAWADSVGADRAMTLYPLPV
jgi:DNA repair exonuclease SbcCD ATPase subunit